MKLVCLPACLYAYNYTDTAEFLPKLLENPAYNMVSQNQGTIFIYDTIALYSYVVIIYIYFFAVMIGNQLTLIDCTSNQAYNHGSYHITVISH